MAITKEQIKALDELQASKNGGRGVSCVQNIITHAKWDDYQSVLVVCQVENDKIRNYPDIQKMLYKLVPECFEKHLKMHKLFGWEIKGVLAEVIADKLEEMQADKEGGYGVEYVRNIVNFLRQDKFAEAAEMWQYNAEYVYKYCDLATWMPHFFGCRRHLKYDCDDPWCKIEYEKSIMAK